MSVRYPIYKIKKSIHLIKNKEFPGSTMALTDLTIKKKSYILDLDIILTNGERIIERGVILKKKNVHKLIENNYEKI